MREIIEALNILNGKDVNIYTKHKLFGEQHIVMKFVPETAVGVGFRCKDQIIYIDADDVVSCQVENGQVIINGNMMQIIIVPSA